MNKMIRVFVLMLISWVLWKAAWLVSFLLYGFIYAQIIVPNPFHLPYIPDNKFLLLEYTILSFQTLLLSFLIVKISQKLGFSKGKLIFILSLIMQIGFLIIYGLRNDFDYFSISFF